MDELTRVHTHTMIRIMDPAVAGSAAGTEVEAGEEAEVQDTIPPCRPITAHHHLTETMRVVAETTHSVVTGQHPERPRSQVLTVIHHPHRNIPMIEMLEGGQVIIMRPRTAPRMDMHTTETVMRRAGLTGLM